MADSVDDEGKRVFGSAPNFITHGIAFLGPR